MKFVTFCLLLLPAATAFSQADPKTENLFIITTDGFRWQEVFNGADSELISNPKFVDDPLLLHQLYWDSTPDLRRKKLMPFLWNTIASEGQIYGNRLYENKLNVKNIYKISYPGYNEMLTGFPDPVFIPNIPIGNRNINILEYLNQKNEFAGKVAVFSSWNIFTSIINKNRNQLPGNCGDEHSADEINTNRHTRYDMITYLHAREYVEQHHPRIVMIGFGETDEFAHSGKYDKYLQQATSIDQMISELWYFIQTSPSYRNKTTLIITTDHGRGRKAAAWYKHGILTSGSGEVWFAIIGPDIQKMGEIKTAGQGYQKQIASTFARLLGVQFNTKHNHAVSLAIPMKSDFNLAVKK